MPSFQFDVEAPFGTEPRDFTIDHLVVAGWTGRDPDKMERHIAELEALGVKRPSKMPTFYRVSASRLTIEREIEVIGGNTSGEAEVLLLNDGKELWVGLASDHTDRTVEAYDITVSKQMCDKPVAPKLWPFDAVIAHWNELILRSYIREGADEELYQEGTLAGFIPAQSLMQRYREAGGRFDTACAMLCGTPPAVGGVRPSRAFRMELIDPVRQDQIVHNYAISEIPPEE